MDTKSVPVPKPRSSKSESPDITFLKKSVADDSSEESGDDFDKVRREYYGNMNLSPPK